MRTRRLSIVLCLAALSCLWLQSGRLAQEPAASKGVELMAQGKFAEALPVLEAEAAADPGNLRTGVARVKCLVQLGRWREALDASSKLAERFPQDPEAGILEGDCLLLNFQPAKAAEAYGAFLGDARWGSTAVAKAASASIAGGQEGQALRTIREARTQGRFITDGALLLEYRAETDVRRKLSALQDLVARNPENPSARDELALFQALVPRGSPSNSPPREYPSKTHMKEIYREPSIEVALDGARKAWLAFDTGSESILLNEDLVKKLALPDLTVSMYQGWGYKGPQETRYVFLKRLEAAGRLLENTPVLVNKRDVEFWTKKGGYLGMGPFLKDVVLYDRRKGVFGLWPAGTSHAVLLGEGGATLPVLWFRGLPLAPVTLQDGEPHPFLLDTGAPYTLLDKERVARLGIKVNSGKYGNIHGLGMSGAFTSSIAESVVIGVAGERYIRRLALVTEIPQSFPVPVYGILGRDILNDFKFVFDGPGASVTLKKY